MNFLSHYYLHNDKKDNFYTVGLTMPDLLNFQTKRIRINKRIISELALTYIDNPEISSFFAGMIVHFTVDSWFHNSEFFKNKVKHIEKKFKSYNPKKAEFPGFYSHILIEILIDRYLLNLQPDLSDKFYQSYKDFNFKNISFLFEKFENFDKDKFIDFSEKVAHSTFLKEYTSSKSVVDSLQRVSKRLDLPFNFFISDDELAFFITDVYNDLEKEINLFINHASIKLSLNKKDIINSNFKLCFSN